MDEYNGWTNWETWNTHLWMTNEEGPYNVAREMVASFRDNAGGLPFAREAGEALESWWAAQGSYIPPSSPVLDAWAAHLASVNFTEIAEALAEE